ncbi:hypothetical protein [uncultured Chryseobacterium sp.]|uniref:hypothetical protein n=1 Tax=uncultured Chryseobacterium sp. TaxID=259322 RepID=UPI0025FB78AC|nr:hypothetical protein [uncultured Chryseobacterium sp.]
MNDEFIGAQLNKINVTYAVAIHLFTLLFFLFGYLSSFKQYDIKYSLKKKKSISLSKGFVFYSSVLILIGIVTSIATMVQIVSPIDYLSKFISGNTIDLAHARNQAGKSGLPGILKMLNCLPLGVFLIVNGIKAFYNTSHKDNFKLNVVIIISLLMCFVKMLFSLDRITLLAIFVVFIYRFFLDKKLNLKAVAFFGVMIFFLGFITSVRMNKASILEFIIVYFKLSIVNFQLVLDNQTEWSYGFNTFLMPLAYIFKFFGVENFSVVGPQKYTVDTAQYFASNLYIDFGYFFFVGFYLMGIFVRRIQIKSISGASYYPQIYFIVLFALASFVSVPIIRGVEFWVMLLLAYLYNKFIKFI